MAKTREKKVVLGHYTKEDAEDILATYAKSISQLKKLSAQMELQINDVRSKHQDKIDYLTKQKDDALNILQHFAESNPGYFEKKKSLELMHGKIGFRTGTPKLKLIKAFNWDRVLEKIEQVMPEFVRTKKEVDKDKLLASREDESVVGNFKTIGVYVDQDETFYVEPKEEVLV